MPFRIIDVGYGILIKMIKELKIKVQIKGNKIGVLQSPEPQTMEDILEVIGILDYLKQKELNKIKE